MQASMMAHQPFVTMKEPSLLQNEGIKFTEFYQLVLGVGQKYFKGRINNVQFKYGKIPKI